MAISTLLIAVIDIIAGLLILLIPGMLRFIVGFYLLIIGILMLLSSTLF